MLECILNLGKKVLQGTSEGRIRSRTETIMVLYWNCKCWSKGIMQSKVVLLYQMGLDFDGLNWGTHGVKENVGSSQNKFETVKR